MNSIDEVMFSRIIDNDKEKRKELYGESGGGWSYFKILVIGFVIIGILALLGI